MKLPVTKLSVHDDGKTVILVGQRGNITIYREELFRMDQTRYQKFIAAEFERITQTQIRYCPECGRADDVA